MRGIGGAGVNQPAKEQVLSGTPGGRRYSKGGLRLFVVLTLTVVTLSGVALATPAYAKAPRMKKPGHPTAVVALPVEQGAAVSWTAPRSDGGSPITGYTVTAMPGAATCTTSGALSCTVSGLTDGQVYFIRVRSSNSIGSSAPSLARRVTAGQSQDCSDFVPDAALQYCHLNDHDLAGDNLEGANLTGATLVGADLDGTDLQLANLTGADLTNASADSANLSDADIDNGYLINTDLIGADLIGAQMSDTNVASANMTEADLGDATMQTAKGTDSTVWSDTTCPDETNSNADNGTCLNDLSPQ